MHSKINDRSRTIIRINLSGILMNLFLSIAKLIVGFMIRSRAVQLDALNGFSDMFSSLVSMLSTLFASKRADREHPFGYGRLEYITSMFSTVFIIYMALHAIYGAVEELLGTNTGAPDYNTAVIVIMALSMFGKIAYGVLSRNTGRRINAVALIMSGTESIGDSVISAAILLTIAINRASGIDLEPWLSILLSLFIVKTGADMIRECVNKLLGSRGDPEEYSRVKKLIAEEDAVLNVFNLVIHRYGEDLPVASVDIEVDENLNAAQTTLLVRKIRHRAAEIGVTLSAVGIYGANTRDPQKAEMWDRILSVVRSHPEFLRAYAFSYDEAGHRVFFSVVLDPAAQSAKQSISQLEEQLRAAFPGISFEIEEALDL